MTISRYIPISLDDFPARIGKLRQAALTNVTIGANRITGRISLQSPKTLCLGIPYSRGWSARIDGTEAEILRANTMFMALPLGPGDHAIELTYFTPGLKAGILLAIIGWTAFICLARFDRRRPAEAPAA